MGVTFTPYVNGTTMAVAVVEADFVTARDYVNTGIVVTDISALAISDIHIYRPESFGFPVGGTRTTLQEAYDRSGGLGERASGTIGQPSSTNDQTWALRSDRSTIFLLNTGPDNTFRVGRSMATVFVEDASTVLEVTATWSANMNYNSTLGGSPVFPDSLGTWFLAYKERGGSETRLTYSERSIAASVGGGSRSGPIGYESGFQDTVGPGVYDVYLGYDSTGAASADVQIIVGVVNFVVEVHKS